jgi:hypothetical protein
MESAAGADFDAHKCPEETQQMKFVSVVTEYAFGRFVESLPRPPARLDARYMDVRDPLGDWFGSSLVIFNRRNIAITGQSLPILSVCSQAPNS